MPPYKSFRVYRGRLPPLRVILKLGATLIVALALGALILIPKAPKTAGELFGTYVLDSPLIHEDLALNPNGTFTQDIRIKATGDVLSSSGRWYYPFSQKYADIVVIDKLIGVLEWPNKLYPDYAKRSPERSDLGVRYWLGNLYIGGEADSWPAYKKVK